MKRRGVKVGLATSVLKDHGLLSGGDRSRCLGRSFVPQSRRASAVRVQRPPDSPEVLSVQGQRALVAQDVGGVGISPALAAKRLPPIQTNRCLSGAPDLASFARSPANRSPVKASSIAACVFPAQTVPACEGAKIVTLAVPAASPEVANITGRSSIGMSTCVGGVQVGRWK
jgi:hypothetical protein